MNSCFNCGYRYADLDEEGRPISLEHCHWDGPSNWPPCADNFDIEHELEKKWEDEAHWIHEFGQPYDYQEW